MPQVTPLSWLQLVEPGIDIWFRLSRFDDFISEDEAKYRDWGCSHCAEELSAVGALRQTWHRGKRKPQGRAEWTSKALKRLEIGGREEKKQVDILEKQRWEIIWLIPERVAVQWLFISYEIGLHSEIRFPDIPGSPVINILPAIPIELSWGSFCFHPQRSPAKTMVYCTFRPPCSEQLRKEARPVECAEDCRASCGMQAECWGSAWWASKKQEAEGQQGQGNEGPKQEDSLPTMRKVKAIQIIVISATWERGTFSFTVLLV